MVVELVKEVKMACRGLFVLGLLVAAAVLLSSHLAVAAEGELARNHSEEQRATKDAIKQSMVNPATCPYGCGYWINGRCRICRPPGPGDAVGDDMHVCGARGCCGRFRGHCTHCCHASEAAAGAEAAAEPQN